MKEWYSVTSARDPASPQHREETHNKIQHPNVYNDIQYKKDTESHTNKHIRKRLHHKENTYNHTNVQKRPRMTFITQMVMMTPLTEEIRFIFGSPDLSVFLIDLLRHGDSVYSYENLIDILGTPVKSCLKYKGT